MAEATSESAAEKEPIKYMKRYVIFCSGALSVAIFLLASLPAWAMESVGVAVDQSVLAVDVAPGETHSFSFSIANVSSQSAPEAIHLEAINASFENENRIALVEDDASGMAQWVRIPENDFRLDPAQEKAVTFSVAVPVDAAAGSYTGVLLVNAAPIAGAGGGTTIAGRVGVHILINVKGEVSGAGSIGRLYGPLFTGREITSLVMFENKGNLHYLPHGELHFRNMTSGRETILPFEKHFVFPGKQFTFSVVWKEASPFSLYRSEAIFVDGDGKVLTARRYVVGKFFPIFPLGVLLIIGGWVLRMKHLNKPKMQ